MVLAKGVEFEEARRPATVITAPTANREGLNGPTFVPSLNAIVLPGALFFCEHLGTIEASMDLEKLSILSE